MKSLIESYSNSEISLSEKEAVFIKTMLENNDCGVNTPEELLSDNFSCQTFEDFQEIMNFSTSQIRGLISSLVEKNVITIEDDRGANSEKLPDLFWVTDWYLETLNPELKFR